eukprot:Nk52_evm9s303 gene=Nk52_evmTU9s303
MGQDSSLLRHPSRRTRGRRLYNVSLLKLFGLSGLRSGFAVHSGGCRSGRDYIRVITNILLGVVLLFHLIHCLGEPLHLIQSLLYTPFVNYYYFDYTLLYPQTNQQQQQYQVLNQPLLQFPKAGLTAFYNDATNRNNINPANHQHRETVRTPDIQKVLSPPSLSSSSSFLMAEGATFSATVTPANVNTTLASYNAAGNRLVLYLGSGDYYIGSFSNLAHTGTGYIFVGRGTTSAPVRILCDPSDKTTVPFVLPSLGYTYSIQFYTLELKYCHTLVTDVQNNGFKQIVFVDSILSDLKGKLIISTHLPEIVFVRSQIRNSTRNTAIDATHTQLIGVESTDACYVIWEDVVIEDMHGWDYIWTCSQGFYQPIVRRVTFRDSSVGFFSITGGTNYNFGQITATNITLRSTNNNLFKVSGGVGTWTWDKLNVTGVQGPSSSVVSEATNGIVVVDGVADITFTDPWIQDVDLPGEKVGGAVFTVTGTITVLKIERPIFRNVSAKGRGGVISQNAGQTTINYLTVDACSGTTGGFLLGSGGKMIISNGVVSNCFAHASGGTMKLRDDFILEMSNVSVTNSSALGGEGGFLEMYDDSSIKFSDVTITNASSPYDGGCIYGSGTGISLDITDSYLDGCVSAKSGGGIALSRGAGVIKLAFVFFYDNLAYSGAGLWLNSFKTLTMDSVSFVRSIATQDGGAMYVRSTSVDQFSSSDSAFRSNRAKQGAIVYLANPDIPSPSNFTTLNLFSDNLSNGVNTTAVASGPSAIALEPNTTEALNNLTEFHSGSTIPDINLFLEDSSQSKSISDQVLVVRMYVETFYTVQVNTTTTNSTNTTTGRSYARNTTSATITAQSSIGDAELIGETQKVSLDGTVLFSGIQFASSQPGIYTVRFQSSTSTFDPSRFLKSINLTVESCPAGQELQKTTQKSSTCEVIVCSSGCSETGGKCVSKDTCQCNLGYEGVSCERPICGPCVRGTCTAPNQCTCSSGWGGVDCSVDLSLDPWQLALIALAAIAGFAAIMFLIIRKLHARAVASALDMSWLIDRTLFLELNPDLGEAYERPLGTHGSYKSLQSLNTLNSHGSLATVKTTATSVGNVDSSLLAKWDNKLVVAKEVMPNCGYNKVLFESETRAYHKLFFNHITSLIGVVMNMSMADYIIWELCPKGSLFDVIHSDNVKLDWNFKFSLILDVAHGMEFLHKHGIAHHHLTPYNAVIDNRWTVKISDWCLGYLTYDNRFAAEYEKDYHEEVKEGDDAFGEVPGAKDIFDEHELGIDDHEHHRDMQVINVAPEELEDDLIGELPSLGKGHVHDSSDTHSQTSAHSNQSSRPSRVSRRHRFSHTHEVGRTASEATTEQPVTSAYNKKLSVMSVERAKVLNENVQAAKHELSTVMDEEYIGAWFVMQAIADDEFYKLFWSAPEVLRYEKTEFSADVYSFGVVMCEIIFREEPFSHIGSLPSDLVEQLAFDEEMCLVHQDIEEYPEGTDPRTVVLIESCTQRDPLERPSMRDVHRKLLNYNPNKNKSVIDTMAEMLEKYSSDLEHLVFKRTMEVLEEKEKAEQLLLSIMPEKIVRTLQANPNEFIAERHSDVTCFFSDIVGFTNMSRQVTASQVVAMLNEVFTNLDELSQIHHLTKIKTIGDAYMAACGVPEPNPKHAFNVARFGLAAIEFLLTQKDTVGNPLQMRAGIHTGDLVAGVVGTRSYAYDLWGDTVNVASRMESNGEPGRVCCSSFTHAVIKEKFEFEEREPRMIKGQGMMVTYLLGKCLVSDELDVHNSNSSLIVMKNEVENIRETFRRATLIAEPHHEALDALRKKHAGNRIEEEESKVKEMDCVFRPSVALSHHSTSSHSLTRSPGGRSKNRRASSVHQRPSQLAMRAMINNMSKKKES